MVFLRVIGYTTSVQHYCCLVNTSSIDSCNQEICHAVCTDRNDYAARLSLPVWPRMASEGKGRKTAGLSQVQECQLGQAEKVCEEEMTVYEVVKSFDRIALKTVLNEANDFGTRMHDNLEWMGLSVDWRQRRLLGRFC